VIFFLILDTLLLVPVLGTLIIHFIFLPLGLLLSLWDADCEVYLNNIWVVFEVGGLSVLIKSPSAIWY
jgi:hypothetical protein